MFQHRLPCQHSIFTSDNTHANPARATLVAEQLAGQGVHIVGIQEARTRAGERTVAGWHVVSGGADSGQLGVEVWLNTARVYVVDAAGKENFFSAEHLTVTETTPRLLVAHITAPLLSCTVVVAHAPHEVARLRSAGGKAERAVSPDGRERAAGHHPKQVGWRRWLPTGTVAQRQ